MKMKGRRYSEVSDSGSDETTEAPRIKKSASSSLSKKKSDSSSDSSSEAEEQPKQKTPTKIQSSSLSPKKSANKANPLEEFISQNLELTRLKVLDAISEDDDVYFLEIPKNIDPQQLLGKQIKLEKKTKLKISGTKYVIERNVEDPKPFTVLTRCLKTVHPIASLQLREYVKHKNDTETIEPDKFTPTLPENLKVRHPLFGAKYEKKIVLDEEIQKKLDNTIDDFVKKLKKKKKHKEKERKSEPDETFFTLLESHTSVPKKKKHKRERNEDDESAYSSLETLDTVEGEKETNFVKKKKKHKKKNSEYREFDTQEVEVAPEKNKKSKKKDDSSKKINIVSDFKLPSFEYQGSEDKKINIINSTVIPGLQLPSMDFDISSIKHEKGSDDEFKISPKRKKKKHRSVCEETSQDELYNGIDSVTSVKEKKIKREADSDEMEEPSPKKKSKKEKKIKNEATDSLIMDILSSVKSEMSIDESFVMHKKKKK